MLVVQWWRNHLKNLRCIEESGLPRRFWEPDIAGSNPAAPIKLRFLWADSNVTLQAAYLLVPKVKPWKYSASCPKGNMSSNAVYREIYET